MAGGNAHPGSPVVRVDEELEMSPLPLFDDPRPIFRIVFHSDEFLTVGDYGIEKIEPYQEPGEMGMVTWFAVWSGGEIVARHNGKYVESVIYRDPAEAMKESIG